MRKIILGAILLFSIFSCTQDVINGKDGVNGVDGKDGVDGINGKDGINGTNGLPGKDAAYLAPPGSVAKSDSLVDGVKVADVKTTIVSSNISLLIITPTKTTSKSKLKTNNVVVKLVFLELKGTPFNVAEWGERHDGWNAGTYKKTLPLNDGELTFQNDDLDALTSFALSTSKGFHISVDKSKLSTVWFEPGAFRVVLIEKLMLEEEYSDSDIDINALFDNKWIGVELPFTETDWNYSDNGIVNTEYFAIDKNNGLISAGYLVNENDRLTYNHTESKLDITDSSNSQKSTSGFTGLYKNVYNVNMPYEGQPDHITNAGLNYENSVNLEIHIISCTKTELKVKYINSAAKCSQYDAYYNMPDLASFMNIPAGEIIITYHKA